MARQPKKTTVTVEKTSLEKVRADMLVLSLFKDTKRLPAELAALDNRQLNDLGISRTDISRVARNHADAL